MTATPLKVIGGVFSKAINSFILDWPLWLLVCGCSGTYILAHTFMESTVGESSVPYNTHNSGFCRHDVCWQFLCIGFPPSLIFLHWFLAGTLCQARHLHLDERNDGHWGLFCLALGGVLCFWDRWIIVHHCHAVHVHRMLGFGKDRQFVPHPFLEFLRSHIFGVISLERDTDNMDCAF